MASNFNIKSTQNPTFAIGTGYGKHSFTLDTTSITPSSYVWVLPPTNGTSGYVLSNNGSGTLSWVAQTGGATVPQIMMYAAYMVR